MAAPVRLGWPILMVLFVALSFQGAALGDDVQRGCSADETLSRLETSYREQGPISFSYSKQTVSAVFGEQEPLFGRAWLDPAGRFRVEAGADIFVGRDDTLWHYVPIYNQVTIRIMDSTARAGLPTDFLWSLRRDYLPVDCAIDTVDDAELIRVRAVARTNKAAIQRLTVWVDAACHQVIYADYVDYNDDRVKLSFTDVKKTPAGSGTPYSLDLPDSVEVVILPLRK